MYIETFVRYKLKKCGTDFENDFDSTGYKMTLLSNYFPFKNQHKVKSRKYRFPKVTYAAYDYGKSLIPQPQTEYNIGKLM